MYYGSVLNKLSQSNRSCKGMMTVELLYKSDWEETKERYLAWWDRENVGRCGLAVKSPKEGLKHIKPPVPSENEKDVWFDFSYIRAYNEYRMSRNYYGGEALPVWNESYPGWGIAAAALGSQVEFANDTWVVHPMIDRGELTDYDFRELKISTSSWWWVFAEKMHRFAAVSAKWKCVPGVHAIGGVVDTLVAIRGADKLIGDIEKCPEYVREFEIYLAKQWTEIYEKFYQIIRGVAEGSATSMNLWSPGRFYVLQNDFINMVSREKFEEIFVPAINIQVEYLDHSIFRLEGERSFIHTDLLCSIPGLKAVQVVPEAGKSPLCYMDTLKKVQASGKNLKITLRPDEIECALQNLSARGLLIETSCGSEEEANYYLQKASKWSRCKKVS